MQITVIYLHSEIIQQVNKVHFFITYSQPEPPLRPLCLTATTASYYGPTGPSDASDVTFSSKAFFFFF